MARKAALDDLAIDAIHMFAFIDTTLAQQQRWAEQALAVVLDSTQPAAQRREASIRNNLGYALEQQQQHVLALQQYQRALLLREKSNNHQATHVARYMVARSLRLPGRNDEALALQQRLHNDAQTAGQPDPYVLDELALLYRNRGNTAQADEAAKQAHALRAATSR